MNSIVATQPGTAQWQGWEVVANGKKVVLPLFVAVGARPGRRMVVLANQHGMEVNGVETARRFAASLDPGALAGSVLVLPTLNPHAAGLRLQTWDEDGGFPEPTGKDRDGYATPWNANRLWPGRQGGFWIEQAVHQVWRDVIAAGTDQAAELVVDIHCHAHPCCVYASSPRNAELAVTCGFENIHVDEPHPAQPSCQGVCEQSGIPALTIELEGTGRFFPNSIREGLRALHNLSALLQIQSADFDLPPATRLFRTWKIDPAVDCPVWDARAETDGFFVAELGNYTPVRAGQLMGRIIPFEQPGQPLEIFAPHDGWLVQMQDWNPVCRAGDSVCRLIKNVTTVEPSSLVSQMRWQQYFPWHVQASGSTNFLKL